MYICVMNNKNKDSKSNFLVVINTGIKNTGKKIRDVIDWKVIAAKSDIHYNTLLTYLRGAGPDVETYDKIICNSKDQLESLATQLHETRI